MQPEVTTEKTFRNQQETIAFLERTLTETLSDAATDAGPAGIRMACIDATTHQLSEAGGDASLVSAEAIAFLKKADDHHVAVVITVGCHHLSIKISPHSCRMTITPAPEASVLAAQTFADQSTSGAQSAGEQSPSSPPPPGLSSGVPTIDPIQKSKQGQ